MATDTDIKIYCRCMAAVRDRINKVETIMDGKLGTGDKEMDEEAIFLQFRKVVESTVYAFLSANKEEYAAQNAKFKNHWRAKSMLEEIGTVNPNFYPIPLLEPLVYVLGRKHFERVLDGFLTRDELISLYDGSSGVLHIRNPYSNKIAND